ncbi:MAG: OmpA family protein [Sphingomonadales bacterium]|nr:OmpA family protein [Sphingomonadales bacterium]MDE2569863.1 OmpA family protein [Sphingomonadales bacterium]
MKIQCNRPGALFALASLAATALAGPAALAQDAPPPPPGEVMATVIGTPPADISGLPAGPDVDGIISARNNDRMQVTAADGTATAVGISAGTEIKASGGFLGISHSKLGADSLLNGLPVAVKTVKWSGGLVASRVELKGKDLKTAAMIRNGTSQRFAEQGAAIDRNAAATEALRGRLGDIDKYNVKDTANVYFDTGKWNLSSKAQEDLCAEAAKADAMDNALLLVVGYTDSVGGQDYNQMLSEKRAGRVVNYLQQACHWKPYRMLTPTGMAEADPTADNSTAQGRAQNRRVSVNILVSKSVDVGGS